MRLDLSFTFILFFWLFSFSSFGLPYLFVFFFVSFSVQKMPIYSVSPSLSVAQQRLPTWWWCWVTCLMLSNLHSWISPLAAQSTWSRWSSATTAILRWWRALSRLWIWHFCSTMFSGAMRTTCLCQCAHSYSTTAVGWLLQRGLQSVTRLIYRWKMRM